MRLLFPSVVISLLFPAACSFQSLPASFIVAKRSGRSIVDVERRSGGLASPVSSMTSLRSNPSPNVNEKLRREEIARKNTSFQDEKRYIVTDGSVVESKETLDALAFPAAPETASDGAALLKKMARMTKPRAYPLFILEKAFQVVDDLLLDLSNVVSPSDVSIGSTVDRSLEKKKEGEKERIVVLGTGWGAAAFMKEIDAERFDVTVISPRNFFLFTPMLAGASVGTVEYRSITQPVREINKRVNFLEGTAVSVDPVTRTVLCESVVCDGNSCEINDFSVEYDRLVLTVGAQTNTYGIPGVREHCCFLKQVEDARKIRTSIVNCFERANLPNQSEEERQNILTFAVIGAGPTGIEFASELRDFVEQDGPKYYPHLLKYVRIKIIEASSSVLAPFDKSLQKAAIKELTKKVSIKDEDSILDLPENFELTELLLDSGVKEVKDNVILLASGKEIPYGLSVWAAGNGPLPITLDIVKSLGNKQDQAQDTARGRVAVDPWLRSLGGEGKIFALGDCSCNPDAQLPATAQVAGQQGEYLARLFSQCTDMDVEYQETIALPPKRDSDRKQTLSEAVAAFAINDSKYAVPFQFLNLGILAYTGGGSALAQLELTPNEVTRVKGKGKIGFALWRSVYLSKQVSWRNRVLVFIDWQKSIFFGRDITRL